MLRAAVREGTPLGVEARHVMDAGGLISDDIILGLIKERLLSQIVQTVFYWMGFLGTIAQAEGLDKMGVELDAVIELL